MHCSFVDFAYWCCCIWRMFGWRDDMSATFEQQYGNVLEEFVAYCNDAPRISRADHLEALLISFMFEKMERWR